MLALLNGVSCLLMCAVLGKLNSVLHRYFSEHPMRDELTGELVTVRSVVLSLAHL